MCIHSNNVKVAECKMQDSYLNSSRHIAGLSLVNKKYSTTSAPRLFGKLNMSLERKTKKFLYTQEPNPLIKVNLEGKNEVSQNRKIAIVLKLSNATHLLNGILYLAS